jgi:hypothetical protein
MAVRVRSGERQARVEHGHWRGDAVLVALGTTLEPFGGYSAAVPDPDQARAQALAQLVDGVVLDPPREDGAPRPPGAVE